MKQILSVCLALFLLLSLSACGTENSEADSSLPSSTNLSQSPSEDYQSQPADENTSTDESSTTGETGGKTLIAYFSLADIVPEGADASAHATPSIGNTESAAMEIQRQVGGDLFAIKTVKTYPVSHRECSAIAEDEMRSDARPELSTHVENMDDYDTVYIGYPIWWYIEPMAIRSFLEEYDFSRKTVIPFCTTLGAGIGESEDNVKAHANGAEVLKGVALRTGRQNMSEDISKWLSDIGMVK